ncbi:LLM class F420-dependent oxidoreductase [Streptomyces sp. NPDC050549]|uniref:LLM class F420-dependent oxidoreductase n=1 Tax=Streptomyces sp. NPDC050549 TaxID=3155406 RepID=UPI00342DB33C
MPRPFRFGASLLTSAPADEWRARCRRAEELGYDVILVPDHLGMVAPFPALVAAADATERPRVGTFVLNAGFWNPTLLAREVATTNDLTGGRLELGLGTGYIQAEHETAGLPFGSPGQRVDHLRRTVEELARLLKTTGPGVPLLLGGNGDRMLRLTAEYADIAAFTGARLVPGDTEGKLSPVDSTEFGQRVARYREFAADREKPAELNLLIQLVAVTDDPASALRPLLDRRPDLTLEQVLDLPVMLVGTQDHITAKLRALRDRHGFSYLTVLEPYLEAFAPVVEELRRNPLAPPAHPLLGFSHE